MEMETEMENKWKLCLNHWSGLTQTTSFSVGQKLNVLIQPITGS